MQLAEGPSFVRMTMYKMVNTISTQRQAELTTRHKYVPLHRVGGQILH
jgi:hypothetical protein